MHAVTAVSFLHYLLAMTLFKPNHVFIRAPFLFIFYLFMLPSLHCKYDHHYKLCNKPFICGNLTNISYPFWGGPNRPQECGRLGFELTNCEDETQLPHIKIEDLDFHISNINSQELLHTMNIARSDLCDSPCTELLVNTTLDYTRFAYAKTVRNLTLYYGCVPLHEQALPNNFTCTIGGTDRGIGYYANDSLSSVDLLNRTTCFTKIRVPIIWEALEIMPTSATAEVGNLLRQGFQVEYRAEWDRCRPCLRSKGTCASDPKTDSLRCLCPHGPNPADRFWDTTCSSFYDDMMNSKLKTAIGVIFCGIVILSIIGLSVHAWIIVDRETNKKDVEAFIHNVGPLAVKRYKFSAVRKITSSFKNNLGQGGYGDVYKGKLLNGSPVAVKVLKESKGNGKDFVNEVASISRTSHVNVVTLLGYCFEGKKKALIYEFMPNGSLEKFIYKNNNQLTTPHLELEKLFLIAIGIARGLEYLHRGCNTRILHFDIKPHNILLDENFCPKISDFGLSKLCTRKESIISMLDARGTIGYIAPEVFSRNFGRVSDKSDVYSYGMLVLEMVGGRKNIDACVSHTSEIYFPDWVYEHLKQGINFGLLNAVSEEEKETARKMILVGMWCIQTRPSDRPSMTKVIEMLEGGIEFLQIPPKPVLSSPVRSLPPASSTL